MDLASPPPLLTLTRPVSIRQADGDDYKPVLERVRVAVLVGLGYALFYALVDAAVYRFKDPAELEVLRIPLLQTVASDWIGAVLGGVLVGILLPIARWVVGAFVLRTLGTLPFFVLVFLLMATDVPGSRTN